MRSNTTTKHRRNVNDKGYLSSLASALRRILTGNGPSQQEIEKITGVDQTTISRAKNGKLVRVTEKVRRLRVYADMQNKHIKLSSEVKRTARTFLAAGGTDDELVDAIQHATSLVLHHTNAN